MIGESSFSALLELHEGLAEIFFRHQAALMRCDIDRAIEELKTHEAELFAHIQDEEELLLPIYQARTGKIPGGPLELFTGEHKKMKMFIAEFYETLSRLRAADPSDLTRSIISLFDRQFMYKHLSEHHDLREKNVLYPWLDRITLAAERRSLLKKCFSKYRREQAAMFL